MLEFFIQSFYFQGKREDILLFLTLKRRFLVLKGGYTMQKYKIIVRFNTYLSIKMSETLHFVRISLIQSLLLLQQLGSLVTISYILSSRCVAFFFKASIRSILLLA